MTYTVPNFKITDSGSRVINSNVDLEKFALDTGLGSTNALLRYSDGVQLALSMLAKPADRRDFLAISTILAFEEVLRGKTQRRHPIGWNDIKKLNHLQKGLN